MDSEAVAMMVTVPVVFGVCGWSFKVFLSFLQQRRLWKHLFDLQNKVLDKYGSSPEALQYLESDAGKALLESASTQPSSHQEIAQALGLRVSSLKSMLFRARKRLAGSLSALGLGPARKEA